MKHGETDTRLTNTAVFFLIAITVLALGLRVSDFPRKSILLHDEASSYISSSASSSVLRTALAESGASRQWTNQWTRASDWRTLLDPTSASRSEIATELATHDVHPPLYFYALNLAQRIIGVEYWTGAALNLGIFTLSLCAFFALASVALQRPIDILAATALWALNPHSVVVSFLTRPYELLTLFTILASWRALLLSDLDRKTNRGDWIWIAALTALGLLTHYQFAIPIGAAAILMLICVSTKSPARIYKSALAVFAGVAVAYLAYPEVTSLLSSYQTQIEHSSHLMTPDPVVWTLETVFAFYRPETSFVGALILLGWISILGAALVGRIFGSSRTPYPENSREGATIILLAVIGGGIIGAFIAGYSPAHAMGSRYLSMAWPLLAIVTVMAFRRICANPVLPAALIIFSVAAFSLSFLDNRNRYDQDIVASTAAFSDAERIVIATPREIVVARIIFAANKDAHFFVAKRPELFTKAELWLDQLKPGDMVAFNKFVDKDSFALERFFTLVSNRYELNRFTSSNGYELGVVKSAQPK